MNRNKTKTSSTVQESRPARAEACKELPSGLASLVCISFPDWDELVWRELVSLRNTSSAGWTLFWAYLPLLGPPFGTSS